LLTGLNKSKNINRK